MKIRLIDKSKRRSVAFINMYSGTLYTRNTDGSYHCKPSNLTRSASDLIEEGLKEVFEGDSVTLEF